MFEETDPSRSRRGVVLGGASIGVAAAAVGVAIYAFVCRVPAGLISDQLGPITRVLGWSLALLVITAAVVVYLGVRALAGQAVIRRSALLLIVLVVATVNAYQGVLFRRYDALVSGPGAQPVVMLAQASWLLVTAAAALVVSAAAAARRAKPDLQRLPLAGGVAAGVAVALVVATVLATGSVYSKPSVQTAAAIDIPPTPTTVGADVAYTVTTEAANWLMAAGPGFVVRDGDSLIAYNGATGQQRWRFPLSRLPDGCPLWALRSTGTGPQAVVLAECWPKSQQAGLDNPFLLALDAMTGQRLWSTNNGWYLLGRVELSPEAVPVRRGDNIASLDPRTGTLRWARPLGDDEQCEGFGDALSANARSILVVASCGEVAALRVLDGHTGEQRSIDLTGPSGLSGDIRHDLDATFGDTAVVYASDEAGPGAAWLVINTATGSVNRVEGLNFAATVSSARAGQYPGAVLQLDEPLRSGDPVRLLSLSQQRITTVSGLKTHGEPIYTGQWWARVGENAVTAAGESDSGGKELVSVAADGEVTRRASPCGNDPGGVMVVPGAVAVLCVRGYTGRRADRYADRYEILGLR